MHYFYRTTLSTGSNQRLLYLSQCSSLLSPSRTRSELLSVVIASQLIPYFEDLCQSLRFECKTYQVKCFFCFPATLSFSWVPRRRKKQQRQLKNGVLGDHAPHELSPDIPGKSTNHSKFIGSVSTSCWTTPSP